MNATTTSAAPVHSSARTVGIALAFVIGAAVAGLATGTAIQQMGQSAATTSYWPDKPLAQHTPSWFASSALPATQLTELGAALATEAYGNEMVRRQAIAAAEAAQATENWPDYAVRHRALISDTFRFTGPSRLQNAVASSEARALALVGSVGSSAALATEAYGNEVVRRQAIAAAEAAQATENYPDYAQRHMAPLTDTFRFTGGSRPE